MTKLCSAQHIEAQQETFGPRPRRSARPLPDDQWPREIRATACWLSTASSHLGHAPVSIGWDNGGKIVKTPDPYRRLNP
jgi:hypothetical protein